MKSPFEEFLTEALKRFENHLKSEGLVKEAIDHRMRGAREFAVLLLGHPHRKGERTKGTI